MKKDDFSVFVMLAALVFLMGITDSKDPNKPTRFSSGFKVCVGVLLMIIIGIITTSYG